MDLTLISIVVGLGLTELLTSLYKLVRDRRNVRWDGLPLAWAAVIALAVVNYWWGIRALTLGQTQGWSVGTFLVLMIAPIFLFLACSAALPRFEPGEPREMPLVYAAERTAFLTFFLCYQGGNWVATGLGIGQLNTVLLVYRSGVCAMLVVALLARSRRVDWLAVAVILGLFAYRVSTQVAR